MDKSRIRFSNLGTMGVEFLYFEALNRHAMVKTSSGPGVSSFKRLVGFPKRPAANKGRIKILWLVMAKVD